MDKIKVNLETFFHNLVDVKMIKKITHWFKRFFVMEKNEKLGFYVCSLIDILGQKEKLIQLNGLALKKDEKKIVSIFRQTYGSIKKFRQHADDSISFVNQVKKKHNIKSNLTSNPVKIKSFSDLVTSYVLLSTEKHKLQFEGIYFLFLSNCEVFLKMLADGIALRGGVDIGMGIETDEKELYGEALSKAYYLESNVAKSIRMVIGQELYDYIDNAANQEIELSENIFNTNIRYAKLCKTLIKQDTDGQYILDYLSDEFKQMSTFNHYSQNAKKFLDDTYKQLRVNYQYEVAKKYYQAIKYFEANGII